MRHPLISAAVLLLATAAQAQVVRCVDANGKVSYTDQRCPSDARQSRQLPGVEATAPPPQPERRKAGPEARAPAPAAAPAGPSEAEQRAATERAEVQQREIARLREVEQLREAEHQRELERLRREADYARNNFGGDPNLGAPGLRPPRAPQDMRPQIQGCEGGGCRDNQGNTYNRSTGKLDHYRSLDGKTCQPVGTTVVCR